MGTRGSATRDELVAAVGALPRETRLAMLEGLESNRIIVGAHASRDGVCSMLAAHREGGRSSTLAFARGW